MLGMKWILVEPILSLKDCWGGCNEEHVETAIVHWPEPGGSNHNNMCLSNGFRSMFPKNPMIHQGIRRLNLGPKELLTICNYIMNQLIIH